MTLEPVAARVLVVDDEPNTREVVSGYLRGDGHRVLTAADGGEALHRFMKEDFDLVITDHGMPDMNGLQLADAVHLINPAKSVILLTGFAFGPEQQPTSIDCVLQKPLVREVSCAMPCGACSGGRDRAGLTLRP